MSADRISAFGAIRAFINSPPGGRWLLVGPVASGKSALLEHLLSLLARRRPRLRIGGIINRGLFLDHIKIGYQGLDCLTKRSFVFAVRLDLSAKQCCYLRKRANWSGDLTEAARIGHWRLLANGFAEAIAAITRATENRCDLVVVDEFGPLERQGLGLRGAVDVAAQSGVSLLLVARDSLRPWIEQAYGPVRLIPVPPTLLLPRAQGGTDWWG